MAMLAFVGVVGGGIVAYELGRSIRDGDLFKTDALPEKNPQAGFVALAGGLVMFGVMANKAVKEVGWTPLALGSVGILAVALIGRSLRG